MSASLRNQASERSPSFTDSVFVNCPFNGEYAPIFEAIVFCAVECGFMPRCALEAGDSGTVRLDKIRRLISGSRFAVHDLSRVEIGAVSAILLIVCDRARFPRIRGRIGEHAITASVGQGVRVA